MATPPAGLPVVSGTLASVREDGFLPTLLGAQPDSGCLCTSLLSLTVCPKPPGRGTWPQLWTPAQASLCLFSSLGGPVHDIC